MKEHQHWKNKEAKCLANHKLKINIQKIGYLITIGKRVVFFKVKR